MNANNQTTRRSFLNKVLGGGVIALLGAIFYPVVRFIIPPKAVEANVNQVKLPFSRDEITEAPKQFKIFKFGREPGIIFLTPEGELRALSATCTHLDCLVQYRPDLSIVWCACHNGRYDLHGKNISGPPPRPLIHYAVKEVDGDVFVSKEQA